MRWLGSSNRYRPISKTTAKQAKSLYRQMVLPFVLTIVISACLVTFGAFQFQRANTTAASTSNASIINSALAEKLEKLSSFAKDLGIWDHSYEQLKNGYDPQWGAAGLASTATGTNGLDIGFVAFGDGRIQPAFPVQDALTSSIGAYTGAFAQMVSFARRNYGGNAQPVSGWVNIDQRIIGCGVSPVMTAAPGFWLNFNPQNGNYLGYCYELTADRLAGIGQGYSINGLMLLESSNQKSSETPLLNYEGRPVGLLAWDNEKPFFSFPLPLKGLGVAFFLILTASFILFHRKLGALIDMISRREDMLLSQQYSINEIVKAPTFLNAQPTAYFKNIAEDACETIGLKRFGIWQMQRKSGQAEVIDIYTHASDSHFHGPLTISCADYQSLFTSMEREDILLIHDVDKDPRMKEFKEQALRRGVRSVIYASVDLDDNLTIFIACEHGGDPRTWTIEEQIYCQSLVNLIGLCLATKDRGQTAAYLREAKDRALAADSEKSSFIARISHEIRTPLNGILGMAQMLLNSTQDEAMESQLQVLQSSSENLLHLLNDILDLSKLEAGRMEILPTEFDPQKLPDETRDFWAPVFDKKKLRFKVSTAFDGISLIKADEHRLRQVVFNLVDNAAKFTENGSVEISFALESAKDGHLLSCHVKDTGIGIPDNRQSKVFNAYEQASAATSKSFGGTGLGLSISKFLIEQMGGQIELESVEGQGSTFSFSVPCTAVSIEAKHPVSAEDEKETPRPETVNAALIESQDNQDGLNILIVEDLEINRKVIALMVDSLGHSYEEAFDGVDAVEKVQERPYDLILMDIQMPRMDGVAATKAIRELDGSVAKTPIIAVTANAMAGDREAYLEAGMDSYLSKPVKPEDLKNAISELGLEEADTSTRSVA